MAGFLPGEGNGGTPGSMGRATRPVRRSPGKRTPPKPPVRPVPLPPAPGGTSGAPSVPTPGPGQPPPTSGPKRLPAAKPKGKYIMERGADGKKVKNGKWVKVPRPSASGAPSNTGPLPPGTGSPLPVGPAAPRPPLRPVSPTSAGRGRGRKVPTGNRRTASGSRGIPRTMR
jgi:hypothetical protein